MYLLGTNVCIDFVRERRKAALSDGLTISAIPCGAVSAGSRSSIDPDDRGVTEAYGRLVRGIGLTPRDFDRLIAAHALALDLTAITNYAAHCNGVPGLKIENWTS